MSTEKVIAGQAIQFAPTLIRELSIRELSIRELSIRERGEPSGNTWSMISYGTSVANDGELRLCGEVQGKRVLELGITSPSNAIDFAKQGARVMVVDSSTERIANLRSQAEREEVTVQCHLGDIADLGFATSASVDLVVASHTVHAVDDLARLLRQVHRVLKPGCPLVLADVHPVAAMFQSGAPSASDRVIARSYGAAPSRSFGDIYLTLQRTNFQVDAIHELPPQSNRTAPYPAVLVLRARKQGD